MTLEGEHLSISGLLALVVILVGAGCILLKSPSKPTQKSLNSTAYRKGGTQEKEQ